jgi:Protein of unknown function (DUF3120).
LRQRGVSDGSGDPSWTVAAAVLVTTLVIDGLFLLSATLQPSLSGLI